MEQSEKTTTPTTTAAWESGDDRDQHEGFGAFGWAILSALLVIGLAVGVYSAYALR